VRRPCCGVRRCLCPEGVVHVVFHCQAKAWGKTQSLIGPLCAVFA
jgi:hypothetical protein